MIENPILLDFPDRFETERLLLRAPQPGEGAVTQAAIRESIAKLRPWLKWAQRVPTVEECEIRVRREQAAFLAREDLNFKIWRRADNAFVGGIGLRPDWSVPSFEIGYWLRTSMQGQGHMTEAVVGITHYAFARLKAQRLEILCDPRNTRSAAVAERAGFTLEAHLPKSWRDAKGELTDSLLYARIAADDIHQAADDG